MVLTIGTGVTVPNILQERISVTVGRTVSYYTVPNILQERKSVNVGRTVSYRTVPYLTSCRRG